MFRVRIGDTVIKVGFSFLAVVALLGLYREAQYILLAVLCCILHELGHVLFMFMFRATPEEIIFYGAGIKIVPNRNKDTGFLKQIFILLAGCITNFLIAGVLLMLPNENFTITIFAIDNLIIGAFNLLPLRYFDGGQIAQLITNTSSNIIRHYIQNVVSYLCVIMLLIFVVGYTIHYGINISLIISIGYIIFSELII